MLIKLLLILPALTLAARIEIEIKGEIKDGVAKLAAFLYGENVTVASDKERVLFGLKDDTIKDAMFMIFGGRPDDVFLSSPTPWGDLYKTYGWSEVERTLVPSDAALLDVSINPEVIIEQMFENNSTKPLKVNVALSKDVENTITSSWPKPADMTVENVKYIFSLDVEGDNIDDNRALVWGEDFKGSRSETLGSKSALNLILQPDQVVTAKLEAKKVTISVSIEYEANLQGSVVANYAVTFRGHHFYKFEVNDVLINKNLPLEARATQVLTFVFYYDSKLVVYDQKMGTQLLELNLARNPGLVEKDSDEKIPEDSKTKIELELPKKN